MSIIHIDGFDSYPDQNGLMLRGYLNNAQSIDNGRFPDGKCVVYSGGNNYCTRAVPAGTTFTAGFAFKLNQIGGNFSNGRALIAFRDSINNQRVAALGVFTGGAIKFGRQNYTDQVLGSTASGLIIPNQWNYLEVAFLRDAAAGAFEVALNGQVVMSGSGVNTGALTVNEISLFNDDFDANKWLDDYYITDTFGRLGECRVSPLRPVGDATKAWVPSSGTDNFAMVDEKAPNGDTDYVSLATPGATDIYDIANLSYTPDLDFAVSTIITARKDDTEVRQVRAKLKTGATVTNGATLTLNTTYQMKADIFDNNPGTAAEWTVADVNALQAGIEVV